MFTDTCTRLSVWERKHGNKWGKKGQFLVVQSWDLSNRWTDWCRFNFIGNIHTWSWLFINTLATNLEMNLEFAQTEKWDLMTSNHSLIKRIIPLGNESNSRAESCSILLGLQTYLVPNLCFVWYRFLLHRDKDCWQTISFSKPPPD